MFKTELIDAIAEKAATSKKDAEKMVNAFMDVVGETLQSGEKIQLTGFGVFEPKLRKERIGRNPRSPEESITIPAKMTAAFKPGKMLKELLNK